MTDQEKASVVKAERELKALRATNLQLSKELEETRALYKQLVDEGPHENFHERRVHLLKSQVLQLERQVLLHTNALSSRSGVLLHVENGLQSIADQLRELLASDNKGPTVPVKRAQLTGLIETAEGARLRLYKNVEANNPERLSRPILFMGSFLKPSAEEDGVTLLDVCSGKIDHLNLKQVAKLESKLFSLHRQLLGLHQSLTVTWSHEHQPMQMTNQHQSLAAKQRLSGLLAQCQKSISESCSDLLSLSILVPAAPWPLITRPVCAELSLDSVMSALPNFPKSKQQQGKACIEALLKACNYSRNVAKLEAKASAEELQFHQSVYDVQIKYMESLFTAVREAYAEFEKSTQTLLCDPLKNILEEYSTLKSSASEEALREFLTAFKAHSVELETVVDILTINKEAPSTGQEALSSFGIDFFASVDALIKKCSTERDQRAEEIEEVKKMKEDHMKNGLKVFERPKPKTGAKSAKEEYNEAVEGVENGNSSSVARRDSVTETDRSARPQADTSVRKGSLSSSKSGSEDSVQGKNLAGKEDADAKPKKGPRVIAKLSSSKDLETVLKETGRTKPPLASKSVPSPVRKVSVGDNGPSSVPQSRIPRSGSLPRLKTPSPRQSPLSSKTLEGSRQTGIPKSREGSLSRQSIGGTPRFSGDKNKIGRRSPVSKPGPEGGT
ncbi:uncharacterized protein [Asterias amurensis]|uniref:uncharacterized protein n=1 Tax=Asterias amurensis TaxID=7602 RepID=UPI003AB6B9F3